MSEILPRPTKRREFIGQVATAAVAIAGTACAAPLVAGQQAAAPSPKPASPPVAPHWDVSWADRITAKHRAVFDSPEIDDGLAVGQALSFMKGYHDVYGTSDADVQAVLVMRHAGVPMAFDSALWEKYDLGKRVKVRDPETGKWAKRNPFTVAAGADPKSPAAAFTLDALRERGAILLGCNLAAMGYAARIAEWTKQDVEGVREEVRAGLVPGTILMPTGIFAVMRAQEAGCLYIRST